MKSKLFAVTMQGPDGSMRRLTVISDKPIHDGKGNDMSAHGKVKAHLSADGFEGELYSVVTVEAVDIP